MKFAYDKLKSVKVEFSIFNRVRTRQTNKQTTTNQVEIIIGLSKGYCCSDDEHLFFIQIQPEILHLGNLLTNPKTRYSIRMRKGSSPQRSSPVRQILNNILR